MATVTETGAAGPDQPPVLSMMGSENALNKEEADKKRREDQKRSIISKLWMGGALASFVLQIVAMAVEKSAVVIVAGIIAMLIAPVVVKRQKDLEEGDALRQVHNNLRQDVNRLQEENNELTNNVNDLETSVDRLKQSEEKLSGLVKEQETTVNDLVGLVKENGAILDEMQKYLKGQVMSDLFDVVLSSDRTGDFKLSGTEVDVLLLRLKNVSGVEVNEEHMRKKIEETGGDVTSVLNILRDLERGDMPEEEKIFDIHPENSRRTGLSPEE